MVLASLPGIDGIPVDFEEGCPDDHKKIALALENTEIRVTNLCAASRVIYPCISFFYLKYIYAEPKSESFRSYVR